MDNSQGSGVGKQQPQAWKCVEISSWALPFFILVIPGAKANEYNKALLAA